MVTQFEDSETQKRRSSSHLKYKEERRVEFECQPEKTQVS